mmetsp:Transcript_12802/g.36200  ORF Transcript_12802/g.36200 Transcript_12802/m.36200 type:complete len:107 (+) Transcript_12802:210-530(+)|eukprot:CAMPEP_0119124228 /NCGR_PEP_ID=MMETSP1310-20130426/3913_1 /TAXON_ID=464262 /ORGANISM="Genus nov. species nov., Strain RCC2339" /LENGTH=106 /DNA_ID=CAMNT_0007114147 /DNA_START=197 /DNA_END=517 /DNA_ORIENTATION=+
MTAFLSDLPSYDAKNFSTAKASRVPTARMLAPAPFMAVYDTRPTAARTVQTDSTHLLLRHMYRSPQEDASSELPEESSRKRPHDDNAESSVFDRTMEPPRKQRKSN